MKKVVVVGGSQSRRVLIMNHMEDICGVDVTNFADISKCLSQLYSSATKVDLFMLIMCASNDMNICQFVSTMSKRWPEAHFVLFYCCGLAISDEDLPLNVNVHRALIDCNIENTLSEIWQ